MTVLAMLGDDLLLEVFVHLGPRQTALCLSVCTHFLRLGSLVAWRSWPQLDLSERSPDAAVQFVLSLADRYGLECVRHLNMDHLPVDILFALNGLSASSSFWKNLRHLISVSLCCDEHLTPLMPLESNEDNVNGSCDGGSSGSGSGSSDNNSGYGMSDDMFYDTFGRLRELRFEQYSGAYLNEAMFRRMAKLPSLAQLYIETHPIIMEGYDIARLLTDLDSSLSSVDVSVGEHTAQVTKSLTANHFMSLRTLRIVPGTCGDGFKFVETVAAANMTLPRLHTWDITACCMSPALARRLRSSLCPRLRVLRLSRAIQCTNSRVTSDILAMFCEPQSWSQLCTLSIYAPLTVADVHNVAQSCPNLGSLKMARIIASSGSNHESLMLNTILNALPHLQILHIDITKVMIDVAPAISSDVSFLQHNRLQELILPAGPISARAFLSALMLPHLVWLYAFGSRFDSAEFESLLHSIRSVSYNGRLRTISLGGYCCRPVTLQIVEFYLSPSSSSSLRTVSLLDGWMDVADSLSTLYPDISVLV